MQPPIVAMRAIECLCALLLLHLCFVTAFSSGPVSPTNTLRPAPTVSEPSSHVSLTFQFAALREVVWASSVERRASARGPFCMPGGSRHHAFSFQLQESGGNALDSRRP
eukprot:6196397-Pleurochrysis_carterae.AAC.1